MLFAYERERTYARVSANPHTQPMKRRIKVHVLILRPFWELSMCLGLSGDGQLPFRAK